jgi:hypothetical protein
MDVRGAHRDGRARGSQVPAATSGPVLRAKLAMPGIPGRGTMAAILSITEKPAALWGNLRGCRRIQPIGY